MTNDVNLIHANLVDHVINLEEYGLKTPEEFHPLPFGLTAQRACASIGPVPQPFLPKDGEAVAPGLVMVKYKPGKEPVPTRELARRGLPYFIVHGALPYLYTFMEKTTLGYHTAKDRLDDQEGFYYFYRLLKPLRQLAVKDYFAPPERALVASVDGLVCAALRTEDGVALLLASTRPDAAYDVRLEADGEFRAELAPESWRRASVLAATRDVSVSLGNGTDGRPSIAMDIVCPGELYILMVECKR